MNHDAADLMTIVLGRQIDDGDVIHCGAFTPLVLTSAMWAMANHAPNAITMPISLTSTRVFRPFPISYSLLEGMTQEIGLEYPMVDVFTHVEGLSGCGYEPVNPLQVDGWGNVNTSVVGDYGRPRLRGPGPAGLGILTLMLRARLILYAPRHSARTLVDTVDFVTAAGNDAQRRTRDRVATGGVAKLVTNLAVFEPDDDGWLTLATLHPGVTLEQVRENTGFELRVSDSLTETRMPSCDELAALQRVDPLGIRHFEFMTAQERRAGVLDLWRREAEFFATDSA